MESFAGLLQNFGGFVIIAMFLGGGRQILQGADSKY